MNTNRSPVGKTVFKPISGNPQRSGQRQWPFTGPVPAVVLALVLFALTPPCGAQSLSLVEGLQTVTSSGYEVRIVKAIHESAVLAERKARSSMRPQVNAYADYTWLKNRPEAIFGTGSSPLGEDHFLRYGVTVRQTITDFGRTSAGVESAASAALAQEEHVKRTQNSMALEFIQSYIDLLKAEKTLEVTRQEVRRFDAHASDADNLYSAGEVTRSDVLSAQVSLADALQREITARDGRDLAASRVNFLVLRPLNQSLQVEDFPSPFTGTPDVDGLMYTAVTSRPEILALDGQINARRAELRLEESDSYPVLFVSGGYSFEENPYRVYEDNWSAVIGLTWDLYTGGARTASREQTIRGLAADLAERERVEEMIHLEVREALLKLSSATERIGVAEKTVDQAEENQRLQNAKYQEGEATATEVTDAVTTLTKAQNNLWSAVYDRQRAEALVLYTSGTRLLGSYETTIPSGHRDAPAADQQENNDE